MNQTAKELAWLKAIPKVRTKIDKSIETTSNLTISAMRNLATSLRSCSRELARGGAPSDRLQPVVPLLRLRVSGADLSDAQRFKDLVLERLRARTYQVAAGAP